MQNRLQLHDLNGERTFTYLCLLIRIIIFDMKRQSKGILIFAMTFYFSIREHEADTFNDSIALLLPSVSQFVHYVMHENKGCDRKVVVS